MKNRFYLAITIIIFSIAFVYFPIIANADSKKESEGNGDIKGTVYIDKNCNGQRNGYDTGMRGVTITLEPGSLTDFTNPSGNYNFKNLSAGIYTVSITVPAGYCSTTPKSKVIAIKKKDVANQNFGIARIPASPDGKSCCGD